MRQSEQSGMRIYQAGYIPMNLRNSVIVVGVPFFNMADVFSGSARMESLICCLCDCHDRCSSINLELDWFPPDVKSNLPT